MVSSLGTDCRLIGFILNRFRSTIMLFTATITVKYNRNFIDFIWRASLLNATKRTMTTTRRKKE